MSAVPVNQGVGLAIPCPCCGDETACITFCFADESLKCNECDSEFTIDRVRDFITRWMPVVHWIDEFPRAKE